MDVLINNLPLNFDLEDEQKISDVVNSISEWSRERDLIFYEFTVDEDHYVIDDIPDKSLDDVKVINCIIQSRADVVFSSVDEGARYSDRVLDFIQNTADDTEISTDDIINIASGIEWLREVLLKTVNLLGVDIEEVKYRDMTLSEYMEKAITLSENIRAMEKGGTAEGVLENNSDYFKDLKNIFRMLLISDEMRNLIMQSIDSPDILISGLNDIRGELSEQLANIEETAIAYQTGKDAEGSERLNGLVDFIYRFTRTCYQAAPVFGINLSELEAGDSSMEEKIAGLMDLLNETVSIMENNDIISLADILEYEIRPAVENMESGIEALMNEIGGRKI